TMSVREWSADVGSSDIDLGRRLESRGSIVWNGGSILFRSGTLANFGNMTIAHDGDVVDRGGGGVLENTGTLHKASLGTVHFNGRSEERRVGKECGGGRV